MKTNSMKKMLSLLLCIALIAALALFASGCNDTNQPGENPQTTQATEETTAAIVKGEGNTVFTFIAVDKEGKETRFEIHTDETVVGKALSQLELIAGEEGPYGLYMHTVNGQTLDWDKDGMYWGFYVNGEYALKGVDQTEIDPAATYMIKAEKG